MLTRTNSIRSIKILLAFFILTFLISWSFWIPSSLASQGEINFPLPDTIAQLIGAWGPGTAAIAIVGVFNGRQGLYQLFRRLKIWRAGIQWYLFVLLWPDLLSIFVTGIMFILGHGWPDFSNPPVVSVYPVPAEVLEAGVLVLLPMVFVTQIFGSSMGEELGWRGFALPELQNRQSALTSSIIVGLIWGLWHFPRMWTPGVLFDFDDFGRLILELVLNSILVTWVFNNTAGCLLIAVLFHTSQAITNLFLAKTSNPFLEILLTILLVIWITNRFRATKLTKSLLAATGEGISHA